MKLSYWERKSWVTDIDFAVIGSGIVGLSCAIRLRQQYPKAKIIVFERGRLPQGASTKNAGFACFGSISEILDDLNHHTEDEVFTIIQQRINGLQQLRLLIGDNNMDYQAYGGYELFQKSEGESFDVCREKIPYINTLIAEASGKETFQLKKNVFDYQKVHNQLIFNQYEGQIDTGKMMQSLLQLAHKKSILILNSVTLEQFSQGNGRVQLQFNAFNTSCNKLFIATNGFSSSLLHEDISPNRAQVLITSPIPNLSIKGTFHMDKGYYYFRNIDNRILFGGGRNLDFEKEETTSFELNTKIQDKLEHLLQEVILHNQNFTIEQRWTGILGLGKKKKSIIKQVTEDVYCGIRLGGMGIAIGCNVGYQMADLVKKSL